MPIKEYSTGMSSEEFINRAESYALWCILEKMLKAINRVLAMKHGILTTDRESMERACEDANTWQNLDVAGEGSFPFYAVDEYGQIHETPATSLPDGYPTIIKDRHDD